MDKVEDGQIQDMELYIETLENQRAQLREALELAAIFLNTKGDDPADREVVLTKARATLKATEEDV